MNRQTQEKSGRVKKASQPLYLRFSQLLCLMDDGQILTADNAHWLIDDDGKTLREIKILWGGDY